jgi:O-antigen/teichoic acid export membrane protein
MSYTGRIFKNFLAIFVGDVLSRLIGIVTAIALARYLGPEDYGKYSLVTSLAYLFAVLSDFGLDDLIVKDVAKNRALAPEYVTTSFIIKLLSSCLSIAALILLVLFMGYSKEIVLCTAIFSIHLIFITLSNAMSSIFKAYERMEYASIIMIVRGGAGLLLIIGLIYFHGTLLEIIFSRVFAFFVGFLVSFAILFKNFTKPKMSVDVGLMRNLIKNAFPFLAIALIVTLYAKVDIIMLSKIKGDLYVGWYTPASNDLFFGLLLIPRTISIVVFPMFSRQFGESVDRMRSSCNYVIKLALILGIGVSAGTFLLADKIIHFVFGPQYSNSIIILRIFSIAVIFVFVLDPLGYALIAINKIKTFVRINCFILVINILLNFVLIQLYGHVGAAITSICCSGFVVVLTYWSLKREIKEVEIARNILKPAIAAALMCVVLYLLRELSLGVLIPLGGVSYLLFLYLLRTFEETELRVLREFLRLKTLGQ